MISFTVAIYVLSGVEQGTELLIMLVVEDAGAGRTVKQDDNPFGFDFVSSQIIEGLAREGFTVNKEYVIMEVPNIVDISYGRGVGYTFTQHDLGKDIHDISATKIRKNMRESGML